MQTLDSFRISNNIIFIHSFASINPDQKYTKCWFRNSFCASEQNLAEGHEYVKACVVCGRVSKVNSLMEFNLKRKTSWD